MLTGTNKRIDLQPYTADLLHLTFEAGADGYAIVDIDGVPMPPIDLAALSSEPGIVLISCPNNAERSYGLTWTA